MLRCNGLKMAEGKSVLIASMEAFKVALLLTVQSIVVVMRSFAVLLYLVLVVHMLAVLVLGFLFKDIVSIRGITGKRQQQYGNEEK